MKLHNWDHTDAGTGSFPVSAMFNKSSWVAEQSLGSACLPVLVPSLKGCFAMQFLPSTPWLPWLAGVSSDLYLETSTLKYLNYILMTLETCSAFFFKISELSVYIWTQVHSRQWTTRPYVVVTLANCHGVKHFFLKASLESFSFD